MVKADVVKASPAHFDYDRLKPEARVTVRQKTGEIRERIGKAARAAGEIGERLEEVKKMLGHGQFGGWLDAEFNWSHATADRYIKLNKFLKFVNLTNLELVGQSALYLLASDATPEEVRRRFLTQAEAGEPFTHKDVKAATDAAKPPKVAPVAEDEEGCSDSPEDEDFDPFEAGEGEGTPAAPPPEAAARRPEAPAVTAAPAETKGSDPQAGEGEGCSDLDPEPWQTYNAAITRISDGLRGLWKEVEKLTQGMGLDRAFAEWLDLKDQRHFFVDGAAQFENHRVKGWASERRQATLPGGRPFLYELERADVPVRKRGGA